MERLDPACEQRVLRRLLAHTEWLTRLARALVGDAAADPDAISRPRCVRCEQLVELVERLGHSSLGSPIGLERFLRRMELVENDERLAGFLLEGHRGEGTIGRLLV